MVIKSKLKQILESEYGIRNIDSIEPIKEGVSNLNYKVVSEKEVYVARVCRYEPENQLRVMLPFLVFAEENSIPAARLFRTLGGELSTVVDDDPVVVSTFIEGSTLHKEEVSDVNVKDLAHNLAKLHGLQWQPEINSATLHPSFILNVYEQWRDQLQLDHVGFSDHLKSALESDHKKFSGDEFLSKFNCLPKQVVHGDLIPGNVMFSEQGSLVAFVDFEEVGIETRLLDISRILTTWFFDGDRFKKEQLQMFMYTYENVAPLRFEEKELFSDVLRYITFRHAVFVSRMLIQGRLSSVERNEEIAVYLQCREEDILSGVV
jgi:Ser/Thr protein kinase RdoA (MazF antagonist)